MSDWILYLALLFALAAGFWQGYRYASREKEKAAHSLDQSYFKGLNYLLNEEPDAAIDSFIQALDVNSETLETHLALGKLLRKRGEVDRAIRVHQNLLARPGLSQEQSQQAQYELGVDFSKAGLLDRAEGLLKELVKEEGPFQTLGLQKLLEVYRDEKEWEQGLEVLQSLSGSRFSKSYDIWAPVRAHFCCELAEQFVLDNENDTAKRWFKQALSYDKQSPRAILELGKLEISQENYNRGIQYLQRLSEQSSDYLIEALPHLSKAYKQLGQTKKYKEFLLQENHKRSSQGFAVALTDLIAEEEGERIAAEFIAKEVRDNPSGMGLHKLLDYYLSFADPKNREHLVALQTILKRVISRSSHYQCRQCGFSSQKLHWLCPSCKQWGEIRPVKDIGEPT